MLAIALAGRALAGATKVPLIHESLDVHPAVNLAAALTRQGARVALVDLDLLSHDLSRQIGPILPPAFLCPASAVAMPASRSRCSGQQRGAISTVSGRTAPA